MASVGKRLLLLPPPLPISRAPVPLVPPKRGKRERKRTCLPSNSLGTSALSSVILAGGFAFPLWSASREANVLLAGDNRSRFPLSALTFPRCPRLRRGERIPISCLEKRGRKRAPQSCWCWSPRSFPRRRRRRRTGRGDLKRSESRGRVTRLLLHDASSSQLQAEQGFARGKDRSPDRLRSARLSFFSLLRLRSSLSLFPLSSFLAADELPSLLPGSPPASRSHLPA